MNPSFEVIVDPMPTPASAVPYPWGVVVFGKLGTVIAVKFGWSEKVRATEWADEVLRKKRYGIEGITVAVVKLAALVNTRVEVTEVHV